MVKQTRANARPVDTGGVLVYDCCQKPKFTKLQIVHIIGTLRFVRLKFGPKYLYCREQFWIMAFK